MTRNVKLITKNMSRISLAFSEILTLNHEWQKEIVGGYQQQISISVGSTSTRVLKIITRKLLIQFYFKILPISTKLFGSWGKQLLTFQKSQVTWNNVTLFCEDLQISTVRLRSSETSNFVCIDFVKTFFHRCLLLQCENKWWIILYLRLSFLSFHFHSRIRKKVYAVAKK